jgi:N-carbamoyl-L-amino-acid hydrolase
MPLRRDALVAAARLIAGVDEMARAIDGAVGTVGRIAAEPNVINTIPGKVTMSVDLRHPDAATLETLVASLQRLSREIAEATGVTIGVNRFWTSEPTPFASDVVDAVQAAADELGVPTRRVWSGAGHDAKYVQDVAPSAMIFARSVNGLSHCEQEYSTPEDLEAGANVLLHAALRLAGIESERTSRTRG